MLTPLVSVVIPVSPLTGESEARLKVALASVKAQTYPNVEILLQSEPGIARARNEGCVRASGKYIAVQDTDDVSYPTRIEKEVHVLEADEGIVGVGSWARTSEGKLRRWPSDVNYLRLLLWNMVNHSSFMVRARAMKHVFYDEQAVFEDYSIYPALLKFGRIVNIQEALVQLGTGHVSHTSMIGWPKILCGEVEARVKVMTEWLCAGR